MTGTCGVSTVSRKQLAAESDNEILITFTSSDEEEKEEEYSENDIFGPDYSSSDNDITENDDDDIESSDHDDQEEAQALTAYDDVIAASSVINDMLDAEQEQTQQMQEEKIKAKAHVAQEQMQQMQAEKLKAAAHEQKQMSKSEAFKNKVQGLFDFSKELFITLPEDTEGTKFTFGISPAKLCDHLYDNTVSPEQVYTVLSNTHIDYLVQLQGIMKGALRPP